MEIFDPTLTGSIQINSPIVGDLVVTGSLIVSGSNGSGVVSKGVTILDTSGTGINETGSFFVWRAPYPASVVNIWAIKSGSSNVSINARKSGSATLHTGSNLVVSVDNAWSSTNSVQDTSYSIGDSLELIVSGSSILQASIQVDFIKS